MSDFCAGAGFVNAFFLQNASIYGMATKIVGKARVPALRFCAERKAIRRFAPPEARRVNSNPRRSPDGRNIEDSSPAEKALRNFASFMRI
ncbi:MAG: hypothetical protein DBX55_06790 [Verrucomicrobia bacterium]|nr:MAG: hypothetical protein DBX55_06790 [Verrucomicrobiota bacterium]